jgi:isocitrate lyase
METAKPGLAQATQFAAGMKDLDKLLAYNLSPSFNWDDSGMTDAQIAGFVSGLGKLGFTWQFITLAGFHGSGLMADRMARNFAAQRNMLAYVQEVQRCEREEGVDVLKHQTWSGAGLVDATIELVLAKADADGTSILGSGSTEAQFGAAPTSKTQSAHS